MNGVTIIPAGAETSEQYHASGAWGSTLIGTFLSSPRLANAIRTGAYRPPETPAMRFGRMFHERMDPGSGFDRRFQPGPCSDRRTKAWKDAAAAAPAGVTLVTTDEWDDLHRMADSVRANPIAASLLDGAEHEVGLRMPHAGFRVQCRFDILHRWTHLADLKTTDDVDEFSRSIATYGYDRQAALYRWLAQQASGRLLPFSFIAVERKEPFYRCRVVDLTQAYMALGWSDVEAALADIADRTARDDWSDGRDAESVDPPAWRTTQRRAA